MKLLYTIVISATLFIFVPAQIQPDSASTALNQFALNFLARTSSHADEMLNIALSPYTVWNVMAIINEGARHNTERQLEKVLGIPANGTNREQFRKLQQTLTKNILKNSEGVSLEVVNALFTRLQKRLNPSYQQMVQKLYNVDVTPLDFDNAYSSSRYINKKLANATRGYIDNIVREDDLKNAEMFVTSALFFKGLWDNKFNKSDTKEKPFYNERNRELGKVQMMYNKGIYPYTLILDETATVVELSYKGGKMSMIVVLPKPNVQLQTVLDSLAKMPFTSLLNSLKQSMEIFGEDNVKVYLPKFKIISDFNLNQVLDEMGVKDAFNSQNADLTGISPDEMFVSRLIHKAEIDVDEEGTVASAVTVAELESKIPPPDFIANRPFAFFIYDKETECIVFTGKYSFPH